MLSGVTIITHGYGANADGWVNDMGAAILARGTSGRLWRFDADTDDLVDVTQPAINATKLPAGFTDDPNGEQVILVDWADSANNTFDSPTGHAEAVGNAIYSLLIGGKGGVSGFLGSPSARKPLHFIAHSFGTVAISEAIQRLGLAGIEVDQMTTLDPHDWDEEVVPVDGEALEPDVHVWSNVIRADNYYETTGGGALDNPHGRPLTGAVNWDLTTYDGFYNGLIYNPHARVHTFYHGTIDPDSIGKDVDGLTVKPSWYINNIFPGGYNYSRIGGYQYANAFIATGHGSDSLTSPPQNSTRSNVNGQADVGDDYPIDKIYNSTFDLGAYRSSHAGYTGTGYSIGAPRGDGDYMGGLQAPGSILSTHLTYVPTDVGQLQFQLYMPDAGYVDDTLQVYFDNTPIGAPIQYAHNSAPTTFSVNVASFRGRSGTISFRKYDPYGEAVTHSRLYVDDLTFLPLVTSSPDLTPTRPASWSAEIVASTVRGTNTDSAAIHSDQSVYLDWAVLNQGSVATTSAQFHTRVYVDDVLSFTRYWAGPLAPQGTQTELDYQLGAMAAGSHKIVIVTDADGEVAETDEANNTTTKWITVLKSPTNDAFADALVLSGPVATVTGGNANATKEVGEPAHAGNAGGASVWYAWTAPSSAAVTLETRGSDFDTILGVYTSGVSGLVVKTSSDNVSASDLTSQVTFTPVAGTTYYIAVDGKNGGAGAATGFVVLHVKQAGASLPDLAAYTPSGWSSSIVVATRTGTTTNAPAIHPGDYVYVDFAVTNQGSASTASQYFAKLSLDGQRVDSWYFVPPHDTGNYRSVLDAQIAPLLAGTYTLTVQLDWTDYIPESSETNNTLTRTLVVAPAPVNNDFATASLMSGLSASATGTNVGADSQTGEPTHDGTGGGGSVWYKWTAPVAGSVVLDTHGSLFNTVLAVYTGTAVGALTYVASNNDDSIRTDGTSALTFTASAGTTYYFAVDGRAASNGLPASGSVSLNLFETPFKPNLVPYVPNGWSGKIVVTTVAGDTTDSNYVHPGETVFIKWGVSNAGQLATSATFHVELLIDGQHASTGFYDPAVAPGGGVIWTYYQTDTLTLGTHTLKVVADNLNEIAESDETDNSFTRSITVVAKPANDDFAAAATLSGQVASATGTTIGATREVGEPSHAGKTGGSSLWYKWVAPVTGTATVDTSGSTFDTLLAAYTGSAVGALTSVGSDDDSGPGSTSLFSFAAIAGTTYYLAVDGYNGAAGAVAVNLNMTFPDLRPTPRGAAAVPVLVSTVTGTSTAASVIHSTDSLYVDWAVYNAGQTPTAGRFLTKLTVDGQFVTDWYIDPPMATGTGNALGISDYALGKLPAGQHVIGIFVDYTDALTETSESNNSYTTTITVGVPTAISVASGTNQFYVRRNVDGVHADVWTNAVTPGQGPPTTQSLISDTSAFSIAGGSGDDRLTLDFSNGNPFPIGGISFTGGAGLNSLIVVGTAGNDAVTANSTGLSITSAFGSVPVTTTSVQSIKFPGGLSQGSDTVNITGGSWTLDADTPTGTPNVSVNIAAGATATFTAAQHLAALTVNGSANLTTAARSTFSFGALTLGANALFDIGDNLVYANNATTSAASIAAALKQAYHLDTFSGFGGWDGASGLTSVTAKQSAAGSSKRITVGYIDGSIRTRTGIDLGANTLAANQILIRPALYGDVNLDGVVDGDDIGQIIQLGYFAKSTPAPDGWADGDLNYDGFVDGDDIGLIIQTGTFSSGATFGPPAPGEVPAGDGVGGSGDVTVVARADAVAAPAVGDAGVSEGGVGAAMGSSRSDVAIVPVTTAVTQAGPVAARLPQRRVVVAAPVRPQRTSVPAPLPVVVPPPVRTLGVSAEHRRRRGNDDVLTA